MLGGIGWSQWDCVGGVEVDGWELLGGLSGNE